MCKKKTLKHSIYLSVLLVLLAVCVLSACGKQTAETKTQAEGGYTLYYGGTEVASYTEGGTIGNLTEYGAFLQFQEDTANGQSMPGANIYLLDADAGADTVIRDTNAFVYLAEADKPYGGDYQASRLIAEGSVSVQISGETVFDEIAANGDMTFSGNGILYIGEEAGTVEKLGVKRVDGQDSYEPYDTGETFTYYDGSLTVDGILYNEGVTIYAGDITAQEIYIAQKEETTVNGHNIRADYISAGLYVQDGNSVPVHLNLGGWLDVGNYGEQSSAYFYEGDVYVNDILYTATFFWIGECDVTVGKYIFMTAMTVEDGEDIVSLIFAGGPQFFYDASGAGTNEYLCANLYVLGNSGEDADGAKNDWKLENWEHGYYAVFNGGINSSTSGEVVLFGGSTDEIAIHGGSCYLVGNRDYSVEGQVQITSGNLNIMNVGGLTTYGRIGINTGSEDMEADAAVNIYTKMTITNAFTTVTESVVVDHEYDSERDVYHSVTYNLYLNEMTYDEMTRLYPCTDEATLTFTNAMLDGLYVNSIEETEYEGKRCINYIFDVYDAAVRTENSNMEASDNSIFVEMDEDALTWICSTVCPTNWYCKDQTPNTEASDHNLFLDGDYVELPDYHPYFAGTGGAVEKAPDDEGAASNEVVSESEGLDDGGANGGNGEGDPMDRPIGGDAGSR